MKAIWCLLLTIASIVCFSKTLAALAPNDNPYYKRRYPGYYSKVLSSEYLSYYDYYDPYVRRSSPVYVISDYNYYTTPYSYYYH